MSFGYGFIARIGVFLTLSLAKKQHEKQDRRADAERNSAKCFVEMSGLEATLFQPKLEEQQEHPRDLPSMFECFKQMSKRDYPRATRQLHWPPSNLVADVPIRKQRHKMLQLISPHTQIPPIVIHPLNIYIYRYTNTEVYLYAHHLSDMIHLLGSPLKHHFSTKAKECLLRYLASDTATDVQPWQQLRAAWAVTYIDVEDQEIVLALEVWCLVWLKGESVFQISQDLIVVGSHF